MFVSHKDLNGRNLTMEFCQRGAERKRCRLAEEVARAGAEAPNTFYRTTLSPVTYFRYLGRFLLAEDDNWT